MSDPKSEAYSIQGVNTQRKVRISSKFLSAQLNDADYIIETWKNPQYIKQIKERIDTGMYSVRDLFLYKTLVERNERFLEFYARRFYPETIQVKGDWRPLVLGDAIVVERPTPTFDNVKKEASTALLASFREEDEQNNN